jgi:hypothetical protein
MLVRSSSSLYYNFSVNGTGLSICMKHDMNVLETQVAPVSYFTHSHNYEHQGNAPNSEVGATLAVNS